ncbi:MAG: transglycosylase domain-containing protein, partial [Actinomycetales bacterium]|nr:transglycosylase domain-containing protein [Actinomycetales bacterium]
MAREPEPRKRRFLDYPRSGKTGLRRWLPSWRLVLGAFLTVLFLGVGVVVAAYMSTTIPAVQDMVHAQTTTVYYADGTTEMGRFAVENREIVDYETLPEHVGLAVVAAEDQTFFDNSGIDPVGTVRALWNNVRYGTKQGGSTLTQQYAERYYQGTTRDYVGKFREALLAVKISQEQDKEEILGNYLNTIYYGRGAYGVQAAAQAYFGTDAADLTVEQSALLAGVIPAPSRFDPRVDAEQAERRWNYVLGRMTADGYVDAAERADMEFPEVEDYEQSDTYAGTQGYLLSMVR